MKETPIIFNAEMVRAIIDGRKTQTRRPIRGIPYYQHCGRDIMDWGLSGVYQEGGVFWLDVQTDVDDNSHDEIHCPFGTVGDRLWVRETWVNSDGSEFSPTYYPATDDSLYPRRNRPSIHMPRWASRITLEITELRVQRVKDISEEDAKAEGIDNDVQKNGGYVNGGYYRARFAMLWDILYGTWDENPWVWAISFKRVK